jgi:putative oxidoreductase
MGMDQTMSLPMNPDLALFSIRVALFLVFVYEGWTKLADLKKYSKEFPGGLPVTLATGLGEFLGSFAMLTGVLAQLAGWGLVLIMAMAGATVLAIKWKAPFHTTKTAGWDFNLLLLVLSLTIALSGPGQWTLANWLN